MELDLSGKLLPASVGDATISASDGAQFLMAGTGR